jgi:hypothetical protein
MNTTPPELHIQIQALGLLILAPLAGALLLTASACDTSPRPAPAIQAENPGAAPPLSAGPVMAAESPSTYATVRPPDGPFEERTPPEGPPRSATMRESARVPHEEFFERYGKEFGLGPKDEMRFFSLDEGGFLYSTTVRYRQYHDGYRAEGYFRLYTKEDGLVRRVGGSLVLGLPDAPEILITKERALELASAELVRHTGRGPAEGRLDLIETVWSLSDYPVKPAPGDYQLAFRCQVSNGMPYAVDISVTTGELRRIYENFIRD